MGEQRHHGSMCLTGAELGRLGAWEDEDPMADLEMVVVERGDLAGSSCSEMGAAAPCTWGRRAAEGGEAKGEGS